ncbi:MAG: hypothetical protein K2J28_02575, partial [Duncaniella sp.]|nr:hypothetical protein [Duncaniella sp.]
HPCSLLIAGCHACEPLRGQNYNKILELQTFADTFCGLSYPFCGYRLSVGFFSINLSKFALYLMRLNNSLSHQV